MRRKIEKPPSCRRRGGRHAHHHLRRRPGDVRGRAALLAFGTSVLHMGPAGSGQLTKTINNMLYGINIAALAEVLPMAVAMGLDPDKLAEVVTAGTSRGYASDYFVPRMLKRLKFSAL